MKAQYSVLFTIGLATACRSASVEKDSENEHIENDSGAVDDTGDSIEDCIEDEPTLNSSSGCIIGVDTTGLELFLGVPYANPDRWLRWKRPVAVDPWAEPYLADTLVSLAFNTTPWRSNGWRRRLLKPECHSTVEH